MSPQKKLKSRLGQKDILLTPGVYDAFGAMMAERAGFEALYISGASIAYTKLGRPDIGLVTLDELEATLSTIRERVDLPLIVDADTGFGNALNVQRTVKNLERAGASAIQLEDQSLPKRCGHLDGKTLVTPAEMNGKIKAALDAKADDDTLIVARTDAVGVEGYNSAMDRVEGMIEAGADILFIEALADEDQFNDAVKRVNGRAPLLINMVEGGKTPMRAAQLLEDMGFGIVIFPGGLVRAFAHTAEQYFHCLKQEGSTESFRNNMFDFSQLTELLGTANILAAGKRYDEGST